MQACPSQVCLFNKRKIEGAITLRKLCLMSVHVCLVLYLCMGGFCRFDLNERALK